jgi:hypothetical protein
MRRRRLGDIFVPEGSVLLQHLYGDAATGAAGKLGVPDRASNGVALIWETGEDIAVIVQRQEFSALIVPFHGKYAGNVASGSWKHKPQMRHANIRLTSQDSMTRSALAFPP